MNKTINSRRTFLKKAGLIILVSSTGTYADDSIVSVDTVVSKLAALGIPGLIVLAIAATTGLAGGAAILAAIALMGGPLGLLGGIAAIAALALAVDAVSEYGFEYIGKKVVERLKEEGHSDWEIREEIDSYPISDSLKNKIKEVL